MNWILKLLFRTAAILLISYLTNIINFSSIDPTYIIDPDVPNDIIEATKQNFMVAFIFAIVLSLLNTFLKPILSFFALPFTFLTLGLFQLVINTVVVLWAVKIVDGIGIQGEGWMSFFNAFLFSILFSAISWAIEQVVTDKR